MIDIERENEFLHEERSAIMSYLQNFTLTAKQLKEYKTLAKALAELVKIKTKISILEEEKQSLTSIRELFSLIGLDEKKLKEQWSKKHTEYMKQSKIYQQKKNVYEKL